MTKLKHFLVLIWKNFIHWIHENGSTKDFILRAIIAVFIYIIISDYLKKLVDKIESLISKGERPNKVLHFFLYLIRYILLTGVLFEIANQLNSVEVDPLVTITACSLVMIIIVLQGALTKLIASLIQSFVRMFDEDRVVNVNSTVVSLPKNQVTKSSSVIVKFFVKLFRKTVGLALAVAIVYIIYQGIFYVTDSGGFEVARMLNMSEKEIAQELDTSFHEDNSLVGHVTQFPDDSFRVQTDGNLNIIYSNNIKVGVNTSSRKYKFYGIGINQPEIENSKRMSYHYDDVVQRTEDIMGGMSKTFYYFNKQKNDCLAITVNVSSNRVVNMTYYSDFRRIEGKLNSMGEEE